MERSGVENGSGPTHEEQRNLRVPRVGINGVLNEHARREVELHDQKFIAAIGEIKDTGDNVEFGGLLKRIHDLSSLPIKKVESRQRVRMAEVVDQLAQQVGLWNVEALYNAWNIRQEKRKKPRPRK